MAKHLIDTDLYVDLIQSGRTLPIIRELYEDDFVWLRPIRRFSLVVVN